MGSSHSPTLALALVVAAAGGLGAVLRALIIHHVARRRPDPLPLGTMVVNASGSLLLGFLTGLSLYHGFGPHDLDVAGVGLCGGYTTWSTASWETLLLLRVGHRVTFEPIGVVAQHERLGDRHRPRPHRLGKGAVLVVVSAHDMKVRAGHDAWISACRSALARVRRTCSAVR